MQISKYLVRWADDAQALERLILEMQKSGYQPMHICLKEKSDAILAVFKHHSA